MTFVSKSHVLLRDAINKIGSLKFDSWSDDELNPIIWNVGDNYERRTQKEIRIADALAEAALAQWGDKWIQAVDRFSKQLNAEQILFRRKAEIDSLKEQIGDEKQVCGWIICREAARHIYREAKSRCTPTSHILLDILGRTDNIRPPSIDTEQGPDVLELDQEGLESYERLAQEEFEAIDDLRRQAQLRFIAVTDWLRQELFNGQLTVAHIAEDGELAEVPKKDWATDRALVLFKSCEIEGRQLLISANYLEHYEAYTEAPKAKSDVRRNRKRTAGRKPEYDWAAAESHIAELFEYHGSLSVDDPVWNCQATVEKAIKEYFFRAIGKEPSTSLARDKAKEFISKYEAGKNSGLFSAN